MLRELFDKLWRFIKEKSKAKHEPPVKDLWWIVPQQRVATALTVFVTLLVIAAAIYWLRQNDAAYDDPGKHEQVGHLNRLLVLSRDSLAISSNLFGPQSDASGESRAELKRLCRIDTQSCLSINDDSLTSLIKFIPTAIRPHATKILLTSTRADQNLKTALDELARRNLIGYQEATSRRGEVYSFELEWDVFQQEQTNGTFRESFYLRAGGPVESTSVWVVGLLVLLAILFIGDYTYVVLDYRWGRQYKMFAGALAETLHYLGYALDAVRKFPDGSHLIAMEVISMLKILVKILESFIARSDKDEAVEIYHEAKALLEQAEKLTNMPRKTEAELAAWQQQLEEIIERTKNLHQRVLQLGKRRFRRYSGPIALQELKAARIQTHQTIWDGFRELKRVVSKINSRRDGRAKRHQRAMQNFINSYAKGLTAFLNQHSVKKDAGKLGEFYPQATKADEIFKTPKAWSIGQIKTIVGKEDEHRFMEIYLPAEIEGASEITLRIEKSKNEFIVSHFRGDDDQEIAPTIARLPALDPLEKEQLVEYRVEVNPQDNTASGSPPQFKIKPRDIALVNPNPDPAPWFVDLPAPKEPDMPEPAHGD